MPRILLLVWRCLKQIEDVIQHVKSVPLPSKLKIEVRVLDASKKNALGNPASLIHVSSEEVNDAQHS